MSNISPERFRNVDESAASAAAAYLARVAESPAVKAYKAATIARLELQTGMRVADVGCGTGLDLPALAEIVGPQGHVIGVDLSESLVAAARERCAHRPNVNAVVCDAHQLPFKDGELDAVRIDRVLLHVEDPSRVVIEASRAVRPGGRVTVSEGDWGSLLVHPDAGPHTDLLFDPWTAGIRHPTVGRQLLGLMADADLGVTSVDPVTAVFRTLEEANALLQLGAMAEASALQGSVPHDSVVDWTERAAEAAGRGAFLASLTGFIVAGQAGSTPRRFRRSG